jgi:hypothetical protein
MGAHPVVDNDLRFCERDACYCKPSDLCFSSDEAESCCEDAVLCGEQACQGSHPIVEGDLRYCEPGSCYCGALDIEPPIDVCYVEAQADACCPVELECY